MSKEASTVTVTLTKSVSGSTQQQRATVRALGITKMHQTKTLPDTPVTRGMIKKVEHLLTVLVSK